MFTALNSFIRKKILITENKCIFNSRKQRERTTKKTGGVKMKEITNMNTN